MGDCKAPATTTDVDRLDGWKEIASYARVSIRTAKRWSCELGFPAYKIGGKVRAVRADVDAWERRIAAAGGPKLRLVASNG